MMRQLIFKMQRAIIGDPPMVLVYDQAHEYEGTFLMTPELKHIFGDEYKIYMQGNVPEEGGEIIFKQIVPDQSW